MYPAVLTLISGRLHSSRIEKKTVFNLSIRCQLWSAAPSSIAFCTRTTRTAGAVPVTPVYVYGPCGALSKHCLILFDGLCLQATWLKLWLAWQVVSSS